MKDKSIILVRTNLLDRDPWLARHIDCLRRENYKVLLLCWDREGKSRDRQDENKKDKFQELRLKVNAMWGVKVLFFLPIWWSFVFFWLMWKKWDLAHAINLDSVIPVVIAGKLKRKPVIYEIYDVYVDLMVLPRIIRRIGIFLEKFFMRCASVVIIANEAQEKEVNGIPNRNTAVIYNFPPDNFKKEPAQRNGSFRLFYAGVLYHSRPMNLDKVYKAIENIDGVSLTIAGYGDAVGDIQRWAKKNGNKTEFIGRITYDEVIERTMKSDLLFALYDTGVPAIRYANCNKLFEAMMCQKPIIVSKGTAMADMVEKEKCGLVVDSSSVDEIGKAIVRLRDNPELRNQLGENGRNAYERKYNRHIMERRLLALYSNALKGPQGRINHAI